jgi:uncharacterized membrane protein
MAEAATQAHEAAARTMPEWVELSATGIELAAVVIIVAVIAVATVGYIIRIVSGRTEETTYKEYRHRIARALLLGLELLVAADVIRTVALEPTLQNVLILGLLVLVRTVLSWSLVVEIEERWPWQAPRTEEGRESGAVVGAPAVRDDRARV